MPLKLQTKLHVQAFINRLSMTEYVCTCTTHKYTIAWSSFWSVPDKLRVSISENWYRMFIMMYWFSRVVWMILNYSNLALPIAAHNIQI
jgi:hypothetical protein